MPRLPSAFACVYLCLSACHRPFETSFDGADASNSAAIRAHGERLSHVLGCTGCHGPRLEGTLMTASRPGYGPLYASNLTISVRGYTDAQLNDIIRKGIHPVRTTLWSMPSEVFQYLSNRDFDALVNYLRTLKPQGVKTPPPRFGPNDRHDIAAGKYVPAAMKVAQYRKSEPVDLGAKYALGRYIATVNCTACHGTMLQGDSSIKAPDLSVVGGYSRSDFERLSAEGIAPGARKLQPTMYYVAIGRLSHMTAHERDALYSYLTQRATSG